MYLYHPRWIEMYSVPGRDVIPIFSTGTIGVCLNNGFISFC